MGMYCEQCQETLKNTACTAKGVCGKDETTSNLQDLLIWVLQGIAVRAQTAGGSVDRATGWFIAQALFATITNANFDPERIRALIREASRLRERLAGRTPVAAGELPACATWTPGSDAEMAAQASRVGVQSWDRSETARGLKALMLYGLKGIAAYADHAAVLGFYDDEVLAFLVKALAAIPRDLTDDVLIGLVLETGQAAVKAMALLDRANTTAYGAPEATRIPIGVRDRPGILISGHDLKDLEELLEQTVGTGVDVYTHGEMLPANAYPAFKKHRHLAGNYGGSWWHQAREFETFHGPILMTTNCIVPVKDAYRSRIFTTGMAGYPGVRHIPDRAPGGRKDFSAIVEMARSCPPPQELETGSVPGGYAHQQVLAVADRVIAAVRSGAIKRFVVMGGCDGRHPSRNYFTEVARTLPQDTVILTAGCAKYRYLKLGLGEIGGIPRVLDAGQCNDSFSLAVIALKLKEAFGLSDINELPISFDLAWYEQKAVAVLLALLSLGVKGIRLGPTLPAFVPPQVLKVLVEKFAIRPTGEVKSDVEAMLAGR